MTRIDVAAPFRRLWRLLQRIPWLDIIGWHLIAAAIAWGIHPAAGLAAWGVVLLILQFTYDPDRRTDDQHTRRTP